MILIVTISKVIYRYWLFFFFLSLTVKSRIENWFSSMDPFSSYRCASAPLLEGLNLGTGTVLTETPLRGRSHFILFFRPHCPLDLCSQLPPLPTASCCSREQTAAAHTASTAWHGTAPRHPAPARAQLPMPGSDAPAQLLAPCHTAGNGSIGPDRAHQRDTSPPPPPQDGTFNPKQLRNDRVET